MARLTYGNELRKRLEELNEPVQPGQFESFRQRVANALRRAEAKRRKAG